MKTNLSLILGLGSIQLVITYIVIFVVLIILLIVFFVLYGGQKGASIASSDKKIDENNTAVRICTSWATTEENVDKLIEKM